MRALLILCLLAGAAMADGGARAAKGYRGGRPLKLRVIAVDGMDVEVSTARAFRAMRRAAADDGVAFKVVSGFRTYERQAELYREWRRGIGNRAARPGYSGHQAGHALDLELDAASIAWLRANGRAFGFYRTVPGEPWHWQYRSRGDLPVPSVLAKPGHSPLRASRRAGYATAPHRRR